MENLRQEQIKDRKQKMELKIMVRIKARHLILKKKIYIIKLIRKIKIRNISNENIESKIKYTKLDKARIQRYIYRREKKR